MVSILSCENYDYENMLKVVKETFDNLGGIEKYIKKGEKVLYRPRSFDGGHQYTLKIVRFF